MSWSFYTPVPTKRETPIHESLTLSAHIEEWALKEPFRIAGYSWTTYRLIVVELTDGQYVGRAEGSPVHNLHETADTAYEQIRAITPLIERRIDRETLLRVMPPGSARNAVDCALWDLEVKRSGTSIWKLTDIRAQPLRTSFTIGIGTPEKMAQDARLASSYSVLKVKLDRDQPLERVGAIRAARRDARLTVDANQAWNLNDLREWAPRLHELGVAIIEQPLPRGGDAALETYSSPVPLCADESCQHRGDLDAAARRYQIINVKLDKAGGLTEALLLGRAVRGKGRQLLVSCMGGTSLAMSQGFVVAQLADYVELDGQTLLQCDRLPSLECTNDMISVPQ